MTLEFATLMRAMLQGRRGWPIVRLAIALLLVLIGNMVGQVRLNEWNGAFFDALEKRNADAFLLQFIVFSQLIAVLLALVVGQTWMQEMLKVRIRERLSHLLLDDWLQPKRAYRLSLSNERAAAPDQRMQEDCRLFSEFTTDLGVGMLQSTLLLVTFVGVLWGLSSNVVFTVEGTVFRIPGSMVWVAVVYAGVGTLLTWLVGRPLIRLNTDRYAREADLRFALVRVTENAEGVALYNGEVDERRNLEQVLQQVLRATRRLSGALSRLTWITSGYGWVAMVVPIIAAAPGYFAGRLSLGELMMVVGAFSQVQSALRYLVDNFPKIADWRSAVFRVSMFRRAMQDAESRASEIGTVQVGIHPEGKLSFEHMSVCRSDGTKLIADATGEIRRGERVLITGVSGCGKTTLFRAIAGLWPWCSGIIKRPPAEEQMFLPQRPYLPLGSLRAAVCYPCSPETFEDEHVRAALKRCGLGDLIQKLDAVDRWDKKLSLGQQQLIAFARLLLQRPNWVFMDEATSALDDDSQASMLSLFDAELCATTVISIAHRPGVEAFHDRTLHLGNTPGGARLVGNSDDDRLSGSSVQHRDSRRASSSELTLRRGVVAQRHSTAYIATGCANS